MLRCRVVGAIGPSSLRAPLSTNQSLAKGPRAVGRMSPSDLQATGRRYCARLPCPVPPRSQRDRRQHRGGCRPAESTSVRAISRNRPRIRVRGGQSARARSCASHFRRARGSKASGTAVGSETNADGLPPSGKAESRCRRCSRIEQPITSALYPLPAAVCCLPSAVLCRLPSHRARREPATRLAHYHRRYAHSSPSKSLHASRSRSHPATAAAAPAPPRVHPSPTATTRNQPGCQSDADPPA